MMVSTGVSVTEEVKVFGKHAGRGWAGERGNLTLDVPCSVCSNALQEAFEHVAVG